MRATRRFKILFLNNFETLDKCCIHLKKLQSAKTAKPWWRCFVAKKVDDNVINYDLVVYLLDDEASTRNGMHEPSVQEAAC